MKALDKALLNLRELQRVRVRVPSDYGTFEGLGTLTARHRTSAGWWVTLDDIPPAWLRRFPLEDSNRSKHVIVTRDSIVAVLPS